MGNLRIQRGIWPGEAAAMEYLQGSGCRTAAPAPSGNRNRRIRTPDSLVCCALTADSVWPSDYRWVASCHPGTRHSSCGWLARWWWGHQGDSLHPWPSPRWSHSGYQHTWERERESYNILLQTLPLQLLLRIVELMKECKCAQHLA